ncbi:MAG: FBP domain-containing protein [Patescibacteria group bacterium UBA2103]
MHKFKSKNEVAELFPKKSRKNLRVPQILFEGFETKPFFSWIHPSGHMGYLLTESKGSLIGLIFDRTLVDTNIAKSCSWCRTTGRGRNVSLFSVQTAQKNKKYGMYLCSNLNCLENMRAQVNPDQPYETLSRKEKELRYEKNFKTFLKKLDT